jgi:hypothetical protein
MPPWWLSVAFIFCPFVQSLVQRRARSTIVSGELTRELSRREIQLACSMSRITLIFNRNELYLQPVVKRLSITLWWNGLARGTGALSQLDAVL